MILRMNIDTGEYKEKPSAYAGAIRNRLCKAESIREVTPEHLIECVKRGRTFTPAEMTGTTGDTWQSQQVICADIDNDTGKKDADGRKICIDNPMTPERAREVMKKYGIDPYFMYYSFSNTEQHPKFRIVLILDEPLTDPAAAEDLTARFTGIFSADIEKCADTGTRDNARLFFGGRSNSVFYVSGQTTSSSLLQALPEVKEETPVKATRTPVELPKEWQRYKTTTAGNGAQRTHSDLQAQFEADKASFDLAAFVAERTTSRPVKNGRNLFFNPCPICGHNDDFQVTGSVYHCHSSSPKGGTSGSVIDFIMNYYGVDMGAACDIFKYDIMGYDRQEWRDAYIAEKYPQPVAPAPQERTPAPAAPAPEQAPAVDVITAADASSYLSSGVFESDIAYFKQYKDRKTGFEEIDQYLTLYPGLAALGGASSLGKTTFVVNLIDRLLDRGETVLYFSLEQLPIEIITKSLARKIYEKDPFTDLTNIDIKNGATSPELEEIKKEYAAQATRYKIITGSFRTTAADIVEYVEKYRQTHGGEDCKPIVIIDYLQLIAAPAGFRGGIREYTDENVKALKDMQKRNGLFVLMISNFNRSSNYEPVSYESFKETSMIEYTCDYIWGLQLSILDAENDDFYTVIGPKGGRNERPIDQKRKMVNEAQAETPKRIEFVSLKNRNGKQFFKAFFDYFPQHDCYIKPGSGFRPCNEPTPWDRPARRI